MFKPSLTEEDFVFAAEELGCEVAAIKAVCKVEAPRGGFLEDGRPTILFERHIFSKRTKGIYDIKYPSISSKNPGGYLGGMSEHNRLSAAATLDRDAALCSASWGKFQIMGFNFENCGFDSVQDFINNMYASERYQLEAFVNFIINTEMGTYLASKSWAEFAKRYNGPNYALNNYDKKLYIAYNDAKNYP